MTLKARHFLGVSAVCMLACLCCEVLGQAPSAAKVVEIRIEGNRAMSGSAVQAKIKTRIGMDYDESIVKDDEKRLLDTGRFESVIAKRTYTRQGVVVVFTVAERPLVEKVVFQGNEVYTDEELAGELSFGISEPLNPYSVSAGRAAILEKYRSNGYHFATVELDEEALAAGRQAIFKIDEGPKSVVRKVRFEGNRAFGNLRLRMLVGTNARLWPFATGLLDVEQVDRDVQAITNLYISEGYLDIEVTRELTFSDDKTKVTVTFVIAEGPRFRINAIIFEGNVVFSDDELAKRLSLGQGVFYTSLRLRRDQEAVKQVYGEMGYVEADVVVSKRFSDPTAKPPAWAQGIDEGKPALLDLVFRIREADQYHISSIDIRGNTVTQSRVIRRELRFFPEQLLNMSAIKESQRRLTETRLFSRVSITPVSSGPKTKSVLVDVAEGDTAQLMVGVGVSTNSGVIGNVSFVQRNFDILHWPGSSGGEAFKGAGQTLRIVAEPGLDLMRFHVDWLEPSLFDKPYSLGTKAFLFTRGRDDYDETRYGGVVSVGHRFKNRWYGELSSRIEGVEISDLDSDAPPEVVDDEGTHALVGMKGTLVRDRTDSRWMPSAGDRFRLSYEQISGGYNFGRALGDYRIYRTVYVDVLDRKHIISARLAAGQIFGDAPVFETFYGGGIGSVRGFEYRGISPRSDGTDRPIGGEFMGFVGAEYGFPIAGQQLRGVVFIDSGTVEQSGEFTAYRASIGTGLRWIVPMFGPVPLSLDIAVPISKDGDDETQLLSFTLGWTF